MFMDAVGFDKSKGKRIAVVTALWSCRCWTIWDFTKRARAYATFRAIETLAKRNESGHGVHQPYYEPIANSFHSAGKFACAVNPLLTDDYGTNRVRKVKTDKKDALKIAEMSAMLNSLLKTLAAGGSSLEFFTRVQYNHWFVFSFLKLHRYYQMPPKNPYNF